ncbi:response regulator transcription factor [Sulfurovum sp. NBC37-1]|uniref:response regulator transcription factor n=1 Tax=Sulfurovum sp. (strain NBC37-1) TaxID=387093 RepID=UPI0003261049|nr:response regulator transcription factor [Sulfurovum sp. NBC37-1]
MMKILLLEDDKILCASLKDFLELEGYSVDTAHRGPEVFDLTFEKNYDLYILDVNVPDIDGFDVLSSLKEAGDETPAIYITALTDINSISKGFEIGAEDYIKKPFDPEELIVRIKSKYNQKDMAIHYDEISYDLASKTVKKASELISLGEVQLNIFHALITQQDKVVDSFILMDFLEQPNANALRVNIAKLKNKLDINIRNIRGQGYMIESI